MTYVRNISLYLVAGTILALFSEFLDSSFLFDFLSNNLIIIQITLLAINTATITIILAKLKEISVNNPDFDFSKTYKSLKKSILEQVIILGVSFVLLILCKSQIIKTNFEYHGLVSNILLTTAFIYSLDILRDTANAIFVITKHE